MSLFFVLISITLTYFSPPEISLSLAGLHIQQMVLLPAFLGTVLLASKNLRFHFPQHLLVIGFWFAIVMSRLTGLWFGGALVAFYDWGIVASVYFLVSLNAFTPTRIRMVCATIVTCATIMAAQGILAYHTGYEMARLVRTDRIIGWGIVSDPNDFAQLLVVALALLGVFFKRGSLRNVLLAIPAAILIYATYRTLSRGAVLGLATVGLLWTARKVPRVIAAALVGFTTIVLIAVGFGGGRDFSMTEASAAGRVIAWGSGIGYLKAHPIFGIGYRLFTDFNDLTAHNSLVLCFAETGLFGYFFWLALVLITIIGLERLAAVPEGDFEDPAIPKLLQPLRAAFYSFLVTSWFLSRTYNETLFILLALCGAMLHLREKRVLAAVSKPMHWVRLTLAAEILSIPVIYVLVRLRTI